MLELKLRAACDVAIVSRFRIFLLVTVTLEFYFYSSSGVYNVQFVRSASSVLHSVATDDRGGHIKEV